MSDKHGQHSATEIVNCYLVDLRPGHDQHECDVDGRLATQRAVAATPAAVLKVATQVSSETVLHAGIDESPGRAGLPSLWV